MPAGGDSACGRDRAKIGARKRAVKKVLQRAETANWRFYGGNDSDVKPAADRPTTGRLRDEAQATDHEVAALAALHENVSVTRFKRRTAGTRTPDPDKVRSPRNQPSKK